MLDSSPILPPPLPTPNSDEINDIINDINNPNLFANTSHALDLTTESSPLNSPAKKKSKTNEAENPPTNPSSSSWSSSYKKKTKKRDAPSTTNPTSALRPGKSSNAHSHIADELPHSPPHIHKHKGVLVELSIDFQKDCFAQFEGDNEKKTILAIQQLSSTSI